MEIKDFDTLKTYKENADNDIQAGKFESAQINIRKGLEFAVKKLCQLENVKNTNGLKLDGLINCLAQTNFGSEENINLMHEIRKKSNAGAHVTIDNNQVITISKEEIIDLYNLIEELYDNIKDFITNYSQIKIQNNRPYVNPDYYSSKRRYYGQWARCSNTQSLFMNDDFNKLFKRAVTQEDIEAMLDIAIGFIDEKSEFHYGNLLYNNIERHGRIVELNGINHYYYYWVIRAMYFTQKKYQQNKDIPLRYIATAIWDAYLYIAHTYQSVVANAYHKEQQGESLAESKKLNAVRRYTSVVDYFKGSDYSFDILNDVYLSMVDVSNNLYPFLKTIFTGKPVIAVVHLDANVNTLQKIRAYNQSFEENTREKILARKKQAENERKERNRLKKEQENKEIKDGFITSMNNRIAATTKQYNQIVKEYKEKSSNIFSSIFYKESLNNLRKEKLELEDKLKELNQLLEEIKNTDPEFVQSKYSDKVSKLY